MRTSSCKPSFDTQLSANNPRRSPKNKHGGMFADAFDYCTGMCRSHGRSTVHENAYISSRHHCFSRLRRPWVSVALGLNGLFWAALRQKEAVFFPV